jgi:CBS domain-containing protein
VHKTVARLLENKGSDVWSVAPDATVYEAIELLAEKGIGALVVLDGDRLVGIVSERDYARKLILKGRESQTTAVRDIMTSTVYTVTTDKTTVECMSLMTEQRIRHLPVVDDDRVIGVISIGDVVLSVIDEQRVLIEQLESYITG